MYEAQKNAIIDKIHKHDIHFSEEEKYLIKIDSNLSDLLLELLENNVLTWDEVMSQGIFTDDDGEVILGAGAKALKAYAKYRIDDNKFDIFDDLTDYLPSSDINELVEYAYKRIINLHNSTDKIFISGYFIELLLERKDYDLLGSLNIDYFYCSDYSCEKFIREFPFEQYNYSSAINNYLVRYLKENPKRLEELTSNGTLARLPFEFFDKLVSQMNLYNFSLTNKLPNNIVNLLFEKFLNTDYIDDDSFFNILSINYTPEQKDKLFNHFIEVGNINLALEINMMYEFQVGSTIYQQLLTQLKQGVKFSTLPANKYELIKQDDFLEAILISGNIGDFFSLAFIDEIPKSLVNGMVNEIRKGNKKYDTMIYHFLDFKDLVNALLDAHFYEPFVLCREYSYCSPEIVKLIHDRLLMEDFKDFKMSNDLIEILIKQDDDFLKNLLDHNKIEMFFECLIYVNFKLNYSGGQDLLYSIIFEDRYQQKILELFQNNYAYFDSIMKCPDLLFKNGILLKNIMLEGSAFAHKIVEYIEHHQDQEIIYNEDVYQALRMYYGKTFNYNVVHMDLLREKFGLKIVAYLQNESIASLINLSDEKFNKVVALFSKKEFNMVQVDAIYESLKQYEFSKTHTETINIFANILHSLEDQDIDKCNSLINKIAPSLNDKFFQKFQVAYPNINASDGLSLLQMIIHNINTDINNRTYYTEMLHFITQYYIASQREEYIKSCDKEEELNLEYEIDEKDARKKIVKLIIRDNPYIKIYNQYGTSFVEKRFNEVLIEQLKNKGLNETLIQDCILYYIYGPSCKLTSDPKLVKANIKNIVNEANNIIDAYMPSLTPYYQKLDSEGSAKRIYKVEQGSTDLLKLLSELNIDVLSDTILSSEHEDVYLSLLRTLEKYSLLSTPQVLLDLMSKDTINISGEISNLSNFISYYYEIYQTEKKKLESLGKKTDDLILPITSIFINAEVYSSVSSVFSQILGSYDSKLVKSNPGPNSASRKLKNNERLIEAVEWTIKNFQRMKVTIPTFNEQVSLDNGKKMQVIVGNFTHPSNITHGERTGACMRIGGVGESLFDFCLGNTNGFHIRFQDPQTGEYISRVSGFRNGNTVFLNELRVSCNPDAYSNEDVVAACKRVAELLIEKSKESTCPIENVVLHNAYATQESHMPSVNLGEKNIKQGLPGFYSDVSSIAIVLATTAKDRDFVPLSFDKSQVPEYLPARERVVEYSSASELMPYIARVDAIKQVLSGTSYEYIPKTDISSEIIHGFANQDWYIYIDSDGVIHENCIDIDKRARQELETAREILKSYEIDKSEVHQYGV